MQKRLTALLMAVLMLFIAAMPAYANTSPTDAPAAQSTVSGSDNKPVTSGTNVTPVSSQSDISYTDVVDQPEEMRDITAHEIAGEINLGWNLGEALDSWAADAGYDEYYNSNAYQLVLRYDDGVGYRSVSIANTFKKDNTASFTWQTGLIESDPMELLGDIGFEIWNLALEDATPIKIKCNKARLTRRNKQVIDFEDLLGEHEIVITKYGTGALLTEDFPESIEHTKGITDGTFTVEVELIDFPQKEYGKSAYFESLWNNPLTTKEMITAVKTAGFNAVRVPVTYFNHTVKDTWQVDKGWLDRVQEVVDYVVDQDMYCIIDMHNDGGAKAWLRVNTSDSDVVMDRYTTIWTQVANRFKNYDEHLLFQGFNDITNKAENWGYPGSEDTEWVNRLNQTFVDTVRSTGSNNKQRCLLIMPYAGSPDPQILADLTVPKDSAADRLMVAVNSYYPADFSWTLETADTSYTDVVDWGTPSDIAAIEEHFSALARTASSKGVPFVVSEFGTADKDNTVARVNHASYYISSARKHNIPCFWWDAGSLLLRKSLTWSFPEIVDAMVNASSIHINKCKIVTPEDIWFTGRPIEPKFAITIADYIFPGVTSGADLYADGDGDSNKPVFVSGCDIVTPLVLGVDYDIEYKNNTDVGTATAKVIGKGNFSGIRTIEFSITNKPILTGALGNIIAENPDLPLVVMLSFPILLGLSIIAVYQLIRRRERERVAAVIEASMRGDYDPGEAARAFLYSGEEEEDKKSRKKKRGKKAKDTDDDSSADTGIDSDTDEHPDAADENGSDDEALPETAEETITADADTDVDF